MVGFSDKTDSEGKYILKLEGNGNHDYTLEFTHTRFSDRTRKVNVTFKGEKIEQQDIQLTALGFEEVSDEALDKKNAPATTDYDNPEDWTPLTPTEPASKWVMLPLI